MSKLLDYFADWDPMGFIERLDAPRDEYSLESATVKLKYTSNMSSEQVGVLTYNVFIELIESDYDGFREECIARGKEIKAILDSK